MFANERYDKIIELLDKNGAVSVSSLVELFDVSTETIRRDLCTLEKQGKLSRVHGGAVSKVKMRVFGDYFERLDDNVENKRKLGKLAELLIKDGDVVAVDIGSTILGLTDALKYCTKKITVVTHFLNAFMALKENPNITPVLLGGHYDKSEFSFYGSCVTDTISKMCFNKMFLAPSAVSLKNGVCDFIPKYLEIQKAMMDKSDNVVVMADSSKYEKSAFLQVCELNEKLIFLSDDGLDETILQLYNENGYTIFTSETKLLKANLI